MNPYKRHLPHDTSIMSLHVALGRLWDAIEAIGRESTTTQATSRPMGASPTVVATSTSAGTPTSFHNSLTGIQGGDVANYYHLTSAEYQGTGTGVFVRRDSASLVGVPTAPTAPKGTRTNQIATCEFIPPPPPSYFPAGWG